MTNNTQKREYKTPTTKVVNFKYDTQVTAMSYSYCDQAWTRTTTLNPYSDVAPCDKCYLGLIWLNEVDPFN